MKMHDVDSSNLKAVGYDQKNDLLRVEFRNGGVYEYLDVPATAYADMMTAESVGKAFSSSIKNSYKFRKVT